MLLLPREASEKDRSLKTELILSTNFQPSEKIGGENVNALCYVNQSYLSTVKGGELAIYCHHFIITQLLVTGNEPENIDEYLCKKNETKLITCLYDK